MNNQCLCAMCSLNTNDNCVRMLAIAETGSTQSADTQQLKQAIAVVLKVAAIHFREIELADISDTLAELEQRTKP